MFTAFVRYEISGGATYDGMVAFASRVNDACLVTRDARALGTYALVGVDLALLTEHSSY